MLCCGHRRFYDVYFFFKQKTAYEMRISDWSSDVCSSDLNGIAFSATSTDSPVRGLRPTRAFRRLTEKAPKPRSSTRWPWDRASEISSKIVVTIFSTSRWYRCGLRSASPIGRASCRESEWLEGVALGGRRIIKKTQIHPHPYQEHKIN